MTAKYLRLSIDSIEVPYNGDDFSSEDETDVKDNLIEASLLYPRSGQTGVSSTKLVSLSSGEAKRFEHNDFWEAGLLKEEIDGETVLELTVSDKDKRSKFFGIIQAVFSGALNTVLGGAVKGIQNVLLGATGSHLQKLIVKGAAGRDERVSELAKTSKLYITLQNDHAELAWTADPDASFDDEEAEIEREKIPYDEQFPMEFVLHFNDRITADKRRKLVGLLNRLPDSPRGARAPRIRQQKKDISDLIEKLDSLGDGTARLVFHFYDR